MEKIVLGLSGGVDSAVSAALLKKEYEVHGLYLDIGLQSGAEEAIAAAKALDVPLTVLDIRCALEEKVCAPFAASYLKGETPNPCILCNPTVKFKALCEHADAIGAAKIATGHYVRTENGALFKGHPANDQSYMLCRLLREQAERFVAPLGSMEKAQVRALAAEMGLSVASKPDSMEICFIPDKDYIGWLSRRGETPQRGDILFHGEVIGQQEGYHRWTVGQRLPGLYNERKIYISRILPEQNAVEAALWEELFLTGLRVRDMNWLISPPEAPIRAQVRVRHTKWEMPLCTVTPTADGGAEILCDEAVRAPAPGQAAAFYDGERLIGGGILCRV